MIRGKIPVTFDHHCIKNMEIGSTRFLSIYDFIFTDRCVMLSIFTEVYDLDDILGEQEIVVPVKRLSSGLSEYDFDIDFSKIDPGIFDLPFLENYSCFRKESHYSSNAYIIFTEFEYHMVSQENSNDDDQNCQEQSDEIRMLEQKIKSCVDDEKYEEIPSLEAELRKLQNTKNKKPPS